MQDIESFFKKGFPKNPESLDLPPIALPSPPKPRRKPIGLNFSAPEPASPQEIPAAPALQSPYEKYNFGAMRIPRIQPPEAASQESMSTDLPPDMQKMVDETPKAEDPIQVVQARAQKAKQDPAFRQKLLKDINDPNSEFKPKEIVNPITEPSKWWDRYKSNMAEPFIQAYNNDRWYGPILLGLAGVSAPFNAVTAIATTTLGYDKAPSFTDAAFQNAEDIYRRGDEWADLGALGTIATGMLLDFAANPLNFVTFGAKPLYTAAKNLARTAPSAAGVSDLAKLSEVGNLRYRQVAKLTPENIKEFAAPQMTLENAKGVFSEIAQKQAFAQNAPVEAINASNKEYANVLALLEGPYKYNKVVDGTTKTFSEMVQEARGLKDLYNYRVIPNAITKPGVPLAEVAQSLARHTAYMEKAIWEARPLLRLAGKTIGWGEWRVPSPPELFMNTMSRAAGKWMESAGARTPVAQSLGKAAADFQEYFTRRLNIAPQAWTKFTGKDMENALQAFQVGVPQVVKGVRGPGGFKQVPGLLFGERALEDWVFAEIDPRGMLNVKNQNRHINHIVNSYKAMRDLISKEPNALWTRSVGEMDQAIEVLERIQKEGPGAFVTRMQKQKRPSARGRYTLPDPRGGNSAKANPGVSLPFAAARTPEQIFEGFKSNVNQMRQLIDDSADVAKNLQGSAAKTPGQYADAMAAAISASKSDFAKYAGKSDEIWVLMDKIRSDWELLMNSTRPYAFDLIDVYQKRNFGHMIDRMRNDANAVKLWVDKYFVNSEKSVAGVESLGKMLQTPGGRNFWQNWANPTTGPYKNAWDLRSTLYRTDPITNTKVPAYALSQQQRMAVQAALGKNLNNLEAAGKMTAAEVNEVATFVGALSDEQVGKLLYTMNSAAASRLSANLRARVVHQLSAPFEAALEKAEALLRTTYASDLRQIYNTYASIQSHFDPNWILTGFYKPGGLIDKVDKLYGNVMRSIGFSPLAETVLRNLESERVHNKYRTEAFGRKWSNDNIVNNALKIDGARFGTTLDRALEVELNEAYGQIISNELSMNYVNEIADKVMGQVAGFKGTFSDFVRKHAKEEFDEGWARLNKVFGGDDAKAKAFFNSVNHDKFLDRLFQEESRLGMQNLPRESYLNYYLTGNPEHIKELQQGIDKVLDDMYGARQMNPSVTSPFFGPGQKRRFLDVAEVIAKAKWENLARDGTKQQILDVAPLYNVSALLGERYASHLNGILSRRSLSDLQAVLPEYVRVFTREPKQGNWKDLGEIVGSFKGKGWYVEQKLYDYMKMYVPKFDREKNLVDMIVFGNQWLTRLGTNFTLNHIKSQAALAYIGQVKPALFQKWSKYMWDNRDKVTKYNVLNPLNLFERMKYSIDNHPMYKEMVSNGVTHFRGDFDYNTTAQNIVDAMAPRRSLKESIGHSLGFREKSLLPTAMPDDVFTTMIFDVIDRGLKMAKYEELRTAGIPAREAANMVNHFLIDYSCRMLNPEVKRMGYTLMPFFSWNVANATLHIPNMLMNPRMYAIARTTGQWVNQRYSPWANHRREDVPSPVAYAVATPWTSSQGYTNWIFPEYPWDAWERLAVNLGKNPTNARYMSAELARFLLSRTRWADWIMTGMNYTMRNKSEQSNSLEELVGTVREPGRYEEAMWGLLPFLQLFQIGANAMVDPNAWKDLPVAAANMLVHVEPVDTRGRIAYSGEFKRNLAKRLGVEE